MPASRRFLHALPFLVIPAAVGLIVAMMAATHHEATILWPVAAAGLLLGLAAFAWRWRRTPAQTPADGETASTIALYQSPVVWVPVAVALALIIFYALR